MHTRIVHSYNHDVNKNISSNTDKKYRIRSKEYSVHPQLRAIQITMDHLLTIETMPMGKFV